MPSLSKSQLEESALLTLSKKSEPNFRNQNLILISSYYYNGDDMIWVRNQNFFLHAMVQLIHFSNQFSCSEHETMT